MDKYTLNPVITLNYMNKDAYILLTQQKIALQKLIPDNAPDHILEGLVNLIDSIQDQCVDNNDIPEDIVFPLPYVKGTHVLSRDGKRKGKLTGGSRLCGMSGCTGKALAVRWEDGKLTYPCTKGMTFQNGTWKIE